MRPFIARREMVLRALREEWGLRARSLRLLHHWENTIFEVRARRGTFIARLSSPRILSPVAVRGELRFMERCAECGIKTALPLPTRAGDLLAVVPNLDRSAPGATERVVALFTKVPGRRITRREMTEALVFRWGATVARMHLATENFRQRRDARRPRWDEIPLQGDPLRFKPLGDESWFRREWQRCEEWLRRLPEEEWGLIHSDLHHGNFKAHRGELYAFDFDDSFVGWRAYDLAVIWRVLSRRGEPDWVTARWRALLDGYRSARPLAPLWEARIRSFERVRAIWIAAWSMSRQDVPNIRNFHPQYIAGLRAQVESGDLAPLV